MAAFLDHLAIETPVVVTGNSLGGTVAFRYPTREALVEKIGERLAWSVEPSIRHTDAGWTLAFSPQLADAGKGGARIPG